MGVVSPDAQMRGNARLTFIAYVLELKCGFDVQPSTEGHGLAFFSPARIWIPGSQGAGRSLAARR